jgi:hypothetical protein
MNFFSGFGFQCLNFTHRDSGIRLAHIHVRRSAKDSFYCSGGSEFNMKQNAGNQPVLSVEFNQPRAAEKTTLEVDDWCYAKELRTLGQTLEAHQISAVEVEIDSGVYFVHGKATGLKPGQTSLARLVRDFLFGTDPNSVVKDGEDVTLRYTTNEIQQLDDDGRAKRKDANKTPDPYSLSQVLRGAGAYLDNRHETKLVGVTVNDRWVTLRYRTVEGRIEQAKEDIEYFFNYWVKMYLRRKNRTLATPTTCDPTLVVTWEGIKKHDPTY